MKLSRRVPSIRLIHHGIQPLIAGILFGLIFLVDFSGDAMSLVLSARACTC
jgi:hypothetical protein